MKFIKHIDWKLFKICSHFDKEVPMENKLLKVLEEAGELAAIWLAYINSDNMSKSSFKQLQKGKDQIMEEALDVLLVVTDIILNLKQELHMSDDEIATIFNKKIEKWAGKVKINQLVNQELKKWLEAIKERYESD